MPASAARQFRRADREVGMKIKRGERERIQIPLFQRPFFRRMTELLGEEIIQARAVQPAGVKLRGGLRRRERLRLVMHTARDGGSAEQRPDFQAGEHAVKLLRVLAPDQNYPANDENFIWIATTTTTPMRFSIDAQSKTFGRHCLVGFAANERRTDSCLPPIGVG